MTTEVLHLQENAPPREPTEGLCLRPEGGLRGVGVFLLARYPCRTGPRRLARGFYQGFTRISRS